MSSFSFSSAPVKKIGSLQFGLLNAQEIESMSVCEILCAELLDDQKRPMESGLLDLRMGTIDPHHSCMTCGGNQKECPGHFGHVRIHPVFNALFLNTIAKLLKCVCCHCGKLLDSTSKAFKQASKLGGKSKFEEIVHNSHKATCGGIDVSGCGGAQPEKISREGLKIFAHFGEKKQQFTPEMVFQLFSRISNDDLVQLGFDPVYTRPESMVITTLPVPPPHIRPTVISSGRRAEDDLTKKLQDIIKSNSELKKLNRNGAPEHQLDEMRSLLQYHCATYMNNDMPGIPPSLVNGRPVKSIGDRLKGKDGRVRGNLLGKRVDFSARTVITPDPTLEIDELGVPLSIASNLTIPEMVSNLNLERLSKLVSNGPGKYPGAKYVIREDGTRIDLKMSSHDQVQLEPGYVVERHLQDGDVVLFNRQPSLHKMSMMGHRVKVMPYSTFRLNLSVTTPYNADFDGDEMNLHVPQSLQTKAELLELMMVPKNIISPQSNRPVIALVQDTLLAASKLTRRDTFLERDFFMNCLMYVDDFNGKLPTPAILKPVPLWTGKQLFSLISPKVNCEMYSSIHEDATEDLTLDHDLAYFDTKVRMERGELLMGILDKNSLGSSDGSLVHIIAKEHGFEQTKKFLGLCQRVINYWLLQRGFSIGISDTIADRATMKQIIETIGQSLKDVDDIIKDACDGKLEEEPGRSIYETFENRVNNALSKARDSGNKAKKSLKDSNNIKSTVTAGSKGSYLNISQIVACVGQQKVEGKRIPFGFTNRTLPHFHQHDYSPDSRGFVSSSYLSGLTPQEFFFHTMGGREGLIDTAVKTAETGYIQRRLVKAMEDVTIKYDGTVRDARDNIIQFQYGDDGIDPHKAETEHLVHIMMNDDKFIERYWYNSLGDSPLVVNGGKQFSGLSLNKENFLSGGVVNEIENGALEFYTEMVNEFKELINDRDLLRTKVFTDKAREEKPDSSIKIVMPVSLKRLIRNVQKEFGIHPGISEPSDMHPLFIRESVKKLCQELAVSDSTTLFSILIRSTLASKVVLREHALTREAFLVLLGEIKSKFNNAMIQPGEMVGVLAAQSIGEPATQMTLNTFHQAGIGSNLTTGVPRLQELLNTTTNIKTPGMTIHLSPSIHKDSDAVKDVMKDLRHITFGDLVDSVSIVYDFNPKQTITNQELDLLEQSEMSHLDMCLKNTWNYHLRYELNKLAMLDLQMVGVATALKNQLNEHYEIAFSDDNARTLVILIFVKNLESSKEDEKQDGTDDSIVNTLKKLQTIITSMEINKGCPGIHKIFLAKEKSNEYTRDGSIQSDEHYILYGAGCDMNSIKEHPKVDFNKTTSNNIHEIENTLGIEACRNSLLKELRMVIEQDSYVNYHHLSLLCDVMTHSGNLKPVTRHGINRGNVDPLMKCSFEETVEMLVESSLFSQVDYMKGVSANVMTGQMARIGTGCFDFFLDDKAVENIAPSVIRSQQDYILREYNYATVHTPMHTPMTGMSSPEYYTDRPDSPEEGSFSPATEGFSTSPYVPYHVPYSPTSPRYAPNLNTYQVSIHQRHQAMDCQVHCIPHQPLVIHQQVTTTLNTLVIIRLPVLVSILQRPQEITIRQLHQETTHQAVHK